MSDELNNILSAPADEYLKTEGKRIVANYLDTLEAEFERLLNQMEDQANEFYLSLYSALDGGVSIESLNEKYKKLSDLGEYK